MLSLSDLPDDILNLISFWLNGFDNCSLWMASDSKLRQRLVNNIITDFDIKYTIPGRYLWPGNFLKKLQKLSHLSLVGDYVVNHLPIHNIEIFAIPTLKSLKLDFVNSLDVIERNHFVSSNNATGPTTSSSNKDINFNDFFSNLEYLEIIIPWYKRSLSIDFLRFLPQNLKTLLIPRNHFELDQQHPTDHLNRCIEILPRTLTSINLDFNDSFDNHFDLSKLPPKLTSLSLGVHLDQTSFESLPEGLKSLTLTRGAYDMQKLSPFLRARLEHLSINTDKTLPPSSQTFPHLESLSLISSTVRIQLDTMITKCSPKLDKFICSDLVLSHIPLPSSLFSNCLTTLALTYVVGISAEFIASLPQSLTSIQIRHDSTINHKPFAYFSLLPRKLKSLNTDLSIVENTSLLPESLTDFYLARKGFDHSSVDPSHFDRLPPKLETLQLTREVPRSILKLLPASLTKLNFYSDELIDDEIIGLLPRGLKQLLLTSPDQITDAGVADLPPYLEILFLCSNISMTDDAIAFLPRTLKSFSLYENGNLTDDCIKHLPRKLTFLSLKGAAKITSNSFKDLPEYLQSLVLPKCRDVKQVFELPPYIQNLDLASKGSFW